VTPHGPLFEGATEQEAARLLERARRRSFDPGEVVFHAGDPADTLHLIQRGRFAVRVTTEFGDVATLNVMGRAISSVCWACSTRGRREARR
jgi:CRP/FNR family cyclic AMP-dependent transcriptional regulator